jgi:hypothetical protein
MLVNDLAYRSFRDIADQDYIAARLSYHHHLPIPSLWQSQQALEKYLKCILLLHRIPATQVSHNLTAALSLVEAADGIHFCPTPQTRDFLGYINTFGSDRYLTISTHVYGKNIVRLDRAVWELRRFCTLDTEPRKLCLTQDEPAPRYFLGGGWLEEVLSKRTETRQALVKGNGFWGGKKGTVVRVPQWMWISNAPLYMHPEILSIVQQFVKIPSGSLTAYKTHKAPGIEIPEEGLEIQLPEL